MERTIGMDVYAASCTLAVVSQTGKRLKDFPVETNGQALVEAIRMIPGHRHLVFEEGLQSAQEPGPCDPAPRIRHCLPPLRARRARSYEAAGRRERSVYGEGF